MRAVILAGGKGRRLKPYTGVLPKPLVPVGDQPILETILRQLERAGFRHVTLTVGHLAELIQAYFHHTRGRFGELEIDFVTEQTPTGTAGSLASIDGLDEPFLVMNGDILTTLDYAELMRHHDHQGGALTIATHRRKVKIDLGVLEIDDDGVVVGYDEKPTLDYRVSMGIYVYDPGVLAFIPRGEYLDFPTLVLKLLEAGRKVVGYPTDVYWRDIGNFADYSEALSEFDEIRPQLGID